MGFRLNPKPFAPSMALPSSCSRWPVYGFGRLVGGTPPAPGLFSYFRRLSGESLSRGARRTNFSRDTLRASTEKARILNDFNSQPWSENDV